MRRTSRRPSFTGDLRRVGQIATTPKHGGITAIRRDSIDALQLPTTIRTVGRFIANQGYLSSPRRDAAGQIIRHKRRR